MLVISVPEETTIKYTRPDLLFQRLISDNKRCSGCGTEVKLHSADDIKYDDDDYYSSCHLDWECPTCKEDNYLTCDKHVLTWWNQMYPQPPSTFKKVLIRIGFLLLGVVIGTILMYLIFGVAGCIL